MLTHSRILSSLECKSILSRSGHHTNDAVRRHLLLLGPRRSLRGRNIRSEKVPQRGQFFVLLRRIAGLRNEKERKNGPLWCFCSRNTFYRTDSRVSSTLEIRGNLGHSSCARLRISQLPRLTAAIHHNSATVTQSGNLQRPV